TERVQGFLQSAGTIAIREFHQRITPEHLLKALLDDEEGAAAGLIKAAGGEYVAQDRVLVALAESSTPAGRALKAAGATAQALDKVVAEVRKGRKVTSPNAEATFDALKKYARDVTAVAREGKLDPVIGRDEEIRRTIQVLARRTKKNPVLIGEPGVGKTAIV